MMKEDWRTRALRHPPELPGGDGPLGYFSDDFGDAYTMYGPAFSRRVVYLREGGLDELLERLHRERLPLFYAEGGLSTRASLLEEGVRRGRLRPFREGTWIWYAVRPAP
jgi:hypothetical protein